MSKKLGSVIFIINELISVQVLQLFSFSNENREVNILQRYKEKAIAKKCIFRKTN